MGLNKAILRQKKVSPFIGHAGVGAAIEAIDNGNFLILRETTRSQLISIIGLGVVSLFPAWILLADANRINGGFFGKAMLFIYTAISLPFLVKHIVRLLRNRRIEIDYSRQKIHFFSGKNTIEHSIGFSDVQNLDVKVSDYRSSGKVRKNFTLELSDKFGQAHDLCTSDQEKNIADITFKTKQFIQNTRPVDYQR